MTRARHEAMYADMEEYHSLLDTLSTCSDNTVSFETSTTTAADETLPPPPLEEPTADAVHMDSAHCRTVLGSMQQMVPIAVRASRAGPKQSGLYFAGEMAVPAGQMLFLTHPTAMAHASNVGAGLWEEPGGDGRSQARAVCDYCFKGPKALVESEQGGFQKGRVAQRCTGCFKLSFCSTACQGKAWRQFHKHECGHLREMRECDPISLIFLRLLLLDEANCLPKNVLAAMQALTDPALLSANESMQKLIKSGASYMQSLVASTKRSRTFARDLLRRIIGNQAHLTRADGSARVVCFDVALANLNHSCYPNAFVFVEGRQARVRTARKIEPGEEITVDLVDLHLDAISRTNSLQLYSADANYVCSCNLCAKEMEAMARITPKDPQLKTRMFLYDAHVIPRATHLMAAIEDEVWEDKRRGLVQQLAELADDATPGLSRGMDPEKDRPRLWMCMAVASIYFSVGDLENALYYALKSFFFQDHRATPDTVADLRILVNVLVAVAGLPETDKLYKRMFGTRRKGAYADFPGPVEFRVFASGCLTIFQQAAVMVFGPKLDFVRAVLYWGRDKERLCDPVQQGSSEYDLVFEAAQQRLVNWCRGGKTDVYAPLRPPTVAQLQQIRMLMDALDDKHGQNTRQNEAPATDHSHDARVREGTGYQADSDTAETPCQVPTEPQWADNNQMRTGAGEDGEKAWPPARTAGMVPVAAC